MKKLLVFLLVSMGHVFGVGGEKEKNVSDVASRESIVSQTKLKQKNKSGQTVWDIAEKIGMRDVLESIVGERPIELTQDANRTGLSAQAPTLVDRVLNFFRPF